MQVSSIKDERVILVDDEGREIGTAAKSEVHGTDTPLHLAFSCYVTNVTGQVLVTRRALGKLTWPGVWTNSLCGHPLPGEAHADAVRRRAEVELGLTLNSIDLVLPDFRYRAVDNGGTVENELCPVFLATTTAEPQPNPLEVAEFTWVDPAALRTAVGAAPWAFSPWMVLQLRSLEEFHA